MRNGTIIAIRGIVNAISIYQQINRLSARDAQAVITHDESIQGKYRHVRIQIPDETEYQLNFAMEATEADILATQMNAWRVI